MKLPTRFQLIGQVGLDEYRKWITWFQDNQSVVLKTVEPITCRSYARSVVTYCYVLVMFAIWNCLLPHKGGRESRIDGYLIGQ